MVTQYGLRSRIVYTIENHWRMRAYHMDSRGCVLLFEENMQTDTPLRLRLVHPGRKRDLMSDSADEVWAVRVRCIILSSSYIRVGLMLLQ